MGASLLVLANNNNNNIQYYRALIPNGPKNPKPTKLQNYIIIL